MKPTLLLFFGLFLFLSNVQAQDWRKSSKTADRYFSLAHYSKAAEFYEKAWKEKSTKKELLFQAAECYYRMRDYRKAAEVYQQLREDRTLFPLVDWKYARALKNDEQYQQALSVLEEFKENYKGNDQASILLLVRNDIEGCKMGLASIAESGNSSVMLENPGENINTVADEFAPIPFSDDILYFSSDMKANKSRIYRSQRISGSWTPAVEPTFPNIPEGHLSNGTFTPDGKRFYFTICKSNKAWDGVQAECDLYVTRRSGKEWATPIKLRDYLRMEGSTATHPFATHIGSKEILYYATDRIGGEGGLDIWYTTREIDSDDYDFTLPQNAGPIINTPGDEITPFYDVSEGMLYFSSNGHPSLGGFDIFKALGEEESFDQPENLGIPYNSSAEDLYFRKNHTGTGGFLVSNRLFGLEKIETSQEDIFTFSNPMDIPIVKGNIIDKDNDENLKEVRVSLYELLSPNRKRLLTSQSFSNGNYEFGLLANKKYRIMASKAGFTPASIDFDTHGYERSKNYDFSLALSKGNSSLTKTDNLPIFQKTEQQKSTVSKKVEKYTRPVTPPRPEQSTTSTQTASPVEHKHSNQPVKTNSTTPIITGNNITRNISSDAPQHQGTYYKVQFTVVADFRNEDSLFDNARGYGRFDTELIIDKGWTRVLVAEFFEMSEAIRVARKLQEAGYPDAFVVKYRNGRRLSL